MGLYIYQARDKLGKLVQGEIEAEIVNQAVAKLQNMNLLILDIKEMKKEKKQSKLFLDLFSKDKIKLKELALFCRQLSFMLEAGVSLIMGLQIIADNQAPPGIKKMSQELARELRAGNSFAEASQHYEYKLPPLLINMIAAAEVGGFLDSALERLANYFDKEVETKEKVKTAMIYPAVVLVVALLAISIVFVFVVPVFSGILESMNVPIPLSTQMILNLSLFFREYWYILLMGLFLLAVSLPRYLKTPSGKKKLDDLLFRIPIIKDLTQKIIVARFCRTLANLLHSGVPILQALEVVENTMDNATLKGEIEKARRNVQDGKSITESFRQGKVFPSMVIQMLAVGEQSGNLDELLLKVSDFYDLEVAEATDRLPKLIEPIMIVVLGIVVGSVVLGVLLPMFSVMESIG